jgi:hypothetical protein
LYRLQDAGLLRGGQAAGIGGQQQISRGVGAFALQALQQRFLLAGHQIDFDAGLLGEIIQQRLDQVFLARRVDIDFAAASSRRRQQAGQQTEARVTA